MAEVAGNCYVRYREMEQLGNTMQARMKAMIEGENRKEEEDKELLLDAGFSLYITIHQLLDFIGSEPGSAEYQAYLEGLGEEGKAYYSKYVGRVEILNAAGDLERVYFRFPEICLLVPRSPSRSFSGRSTARRRASGSRSSSTWRTTSTSRCGTRRTCRSWRRGASCSSTRSTPPTPSSSPRSCRTLCSCCATPPMAQWTQTR
jgi:hypothetical protein